MPVYFQKPENALKRAKEFIVVGNKASGLEVLNDVIRSKKHRSWTQEHERIMLLYTELCIDLQRSAYAKDGLYQYRNICKETSLNSFQKVIKNFLAMAEARAAAAREQSDAAATSLLDVEDLDYMQTPESLLLSTVSGEGAKERTDRVVLMPWVKFLWESYRNMLELLKNNGTVETVYADVAKQAFSFCLNYQRRTEFRKLCDILRNHLNQAQKYQNQMYSLKFDSPDTIQCLVDVRFTQLESSISVDLWQEAFKAIEEIHNLLDISGKAPKPGLLDNFYSKQAHVFLMANNRLFHAAALHKLFFLRKEQKKAFGPTSEEARQTASQLLLATLAVAISPVPSATDRFLEVDDMSRDKARRLAALLRMSTPPSRASLMEDVLHHNVLQFVSPELQQLHHYLEEEFNPLDLCQAVAPLLEGLEGNPLLCQYVAPLKEVLLVRLIKQVSQVYDCIELSRLASLAPFDSLTHLEKVVVETARTNGIQVRIDHLSQSLRFGTTMTFAHKEESPEGPFVQAMPSEDLCGQLTLMSCALQQAVSIIAASEIETERALQAKRVAVSVQQHGRADHKAALQRRHLIEARKEFLEHRNRTKEEEEEQQRRAKEKEERRAEMERLAREAKEREAERVRREMDELKRKLMQEKIEGLKKTAVGARALADIPAEEVEQMEVDEIMAKQLRQMEKERRDKETRLKAQEKKVDYFERAKRMCELPKLTVQYAHQRDQDHRFHDDQEEERIATAIREREEAERLSGRLRVMAEAKGGFLEALKARRSQQHKAALAAFAVRLSEEREVRLATRKKERRERRKAEAAAAHRAEEERMVHERAEEARREREEEKQRQAEELEQQQERQRQREREVEERRTRREEERARELEQQRRREEERRGPPPREGGGGGTEEDWRRPAAREKDVSPRRDEPDRYPPRRDDRSWRDDQDRYSGRRDEPDRYTGRRDEPDRYTGRRDEPDRYSGRRDEPDRYTGRRDEPDRYSGRREEGERGGVYRPPAARAGWRSKEAEEEGWKRGPSSFDRDRRGGEREPDRRPWGREEERGGGGWRGREDRGPPPGREDGGGWRGREDGGGWRGREERPVRGREGEERGPPPGREEQERGGGGGWRGRGREDEDQERGGGWRGRGRGEEGGPERGWRGREEDQGPPRRDEEQRGGWRRDDGPAPARDPSPTRGRRVDEEGFEVVGRGRR